MGEITRRGFLKLTAAALGALAFHLPESPGSGPEQGRLSEVGLGDYYDVWLEGKKFEDSLGAKPPIFNEVYECLNGIVSKEVDSFDPSVSLLRDGWGVKESQVVDEAVKYVDKLMIHIDPTKVKDSKEEVQSFLRRVANTYPLHILAMPPNVVIFQNGGEAGWDHIAFATTHDPEQAAVSWIHEATHELDGGGWKKVKPFMNKRNFIKYVKTYYACIHDVLVNYLNLPESEAIRVTKNGKAVEITISPITAENIQLFSIWGFDEEKLVATSLNKDMEKQLQEWASVFGIEGNIEIPSNKADMLTTAWSIFLHRVGNRLRSMNSEQRRALLQTNPKAADIVSATMYGLSFPDYNIFFEGCLGVIAHYLVGPVQAKGGGLPDSPFKPEFSFLVNSAAKLQQVRLASFSRLPPYPTYPQIRESFGLTPKFPETEEERLHRCLAIALATGGAALFTAVKFVEIVTNKSNYQKHTKKFGSKVTSKVFGGEPPILIDDEGKVRTENNGGYKLQPREIVRADSFELDTFEPTVVILTDDHRQDSIIVFPPLNRTTVFGYGKHYNNLGVLVAGPVFGEESNTFRVAHTPDFGYSDVRGPGIIQGKPYGMHWEKGLTMHIGDRIQHIRLPWNYKKGEEKKITKVSLGKLSRLLL